MKERDDKKRKESEQEKVEEIFNELESLKQQVEEFQNNYKRALADYQNLQKRVQEEKSEWIRSGNNRPSNSQRLSIGLQLPQAHSIRRAGF